MGTAAAVILMKERQLVEAFRRGGAVDAAHAVNPDSLDVDADGLGWRRLRDRAVIRESSAGSGAYYVDVEVWEALRRTRRRMVLVLFAVLLAALYAAYASGWGRGVS